MLKGIFVIIGGMADLPNKQLGMKTPLEIAYTPNLDFLSTRGEMGYMYPVKPGFIPESNEALISIFGNNFISGTRGQLEARGVGLNLTRGDLALRVNFATVDSSGKKILDRRAGRTLTTAEAEILSKSLNNKIKLSCKFVFESTLQHRAILVLKGGFSEILGNDATPVGGKLQNTLDAGFCKSLDDDENSQYSNNVANEFIIKAHEILKNHSVNEERKRKGLLPANYLLVRGAGVEIPKLKQYKKWLSVSYTPLEIGFSKTSGMNVFSFNYPKLKRFDAYENLYDGLKKACKFSIKVLKKNRKKVDYALICLKEPDFSGHDNKPFEKKLMLEYIDKTLINFLRKFAPPKKIKVVVTSDHSTICKFKEHSADPVPVLFYNGSILKEKKFCEREARKGTLRRILGKDLLKKVGFSC